MFWFDKENPQALFMDKRSETLHRKDRKQKIVVRPDIEADFTDMPFAEGTFNLVVFDPPHLTSLGKNSFMHKLYGRLEANWQDTLRNGFSECFRVLKNGGILVFKWNEYDITVSEVLKLTPVRPLFGNRCGKQAKTHWICFMKQAN